MRRIPSFVRASSTEIIAHTLQPGKKAFTILLKVVVFRLGFPEVVHELVNAKIAHDLRVRPCTANGARSGHFHSKNGIIQKLYRSLRIE